MGKKHDKKKKTTKVVLSLGEFNEGAGIGGIDPELAALPSAPKAAEDWEAEGGRPEYNSRGYKERKAYADRNYDADAEFEERDWVRKGPMEAEEGAFGAGGGDRDWSGMRRGPLDAPEGAADQQERDWNGMRRGPVESAFEGAPAERDWGARKGPVEAELGSAKGRLIDDDTWGSARGNAVEAEFPDGAPKDRDWGVRKGPVEAEGVEPAQEADWSARKGPVESEFAAQDPSRDWTQRKGPVEAVAVKGEDADWTARKGPVEAEVPEKRPDVAERDWTARRGPVEKEVESAQKAVRDIDFGDVRRGARLQQLEEEATASKDTPQRPATGDRWRRDAAVPARASPVEPRERPASTGHDGPPKPERDWGAARRTQPVRAMSRPNRASTGRPSNPANVSEFAKVDSQEANAEDKDDQWTTVRNAPAKRLSGSVGNRRFSGRGSLQEREDRDMRGARDKATSSPVTPVASAVSES